MSSLEDKLAQVLRRETVRLGSYEMELHDNYTAGPNEAPKGPLVARWTHSSRAVVVCGNERFFGIERWKGKVVNGGSRSWPFYRGRVT